MVYDENDLLPFNERLEMNEPFLGSESFSFSSRVVSFCGLADSTPVCYNSFDVYSRFLEGWAPGRDRGYICNRRRDF